MLQLDDPGKKTPEKRHFIHEKIVGRPISKRYTAKRIMFIFFAALMFGAVAAASFVVTLPFAERYLGEETVTESMTVSIPKDEPESTPAVTEPPPTPEETEPLEEVLQSVMERYEYSAEDLSSMYGKFNAVALEADKAIVTVHSVKQDRDWFDNLVETDGQYAGAVIANTEQELLILTTSEAVEKADSIKVTLGNGSAVDGWVKQQDSVWGMAIVSVDMTRLDEYDKNTIRTITLGNSFAVKQGDMVAAVGSPVGIVHSLDYGFISFIRRNVPVMDGMSRILYSTIGQNATEGTFLINLNGELIGWVTNKYSGDTKEHVVSIMGISDYKGILEKMTNGHSVPYVGIIGQMVNEEITGTRIPSGIYVSNSVVDGPAYSAGIQNGDIITKFGENTPSNLKDFQNQLESLNEGDVITITIQRNAREDYTELEYQVTIGAR